MFFLCIVKCALTTYAPSALVKLVIRKSTFTSCVLSAGRSRHIKPVIRKPIPIARPSAGRWTAAHNLACKKAALHATSPHERTASGEVSEHGFSLLGTKLAQVTTRSAERRVSAYLAY